MAAVPGAIAVWSGSRPYLATYRIPPDGLTLGRDQVESDDDRSSRQHIQVRSIIDGRQVVVTDLGSRNGTYVACRPVVDHETSVPLPTIVRTGRTVWALVADVTGYEGIEARRGATARTSAQALDEAARAEDHVLLLGSRAAGRELATTYARTLGGEGVWFDPSLAIPAERVLGINAPLRTIVLELSAPLTDEDIAVLDPYFETDVRFAVIAASGRELRANAGRLAERLRGRLIAIPLPMFVELPARLLERFRCVAANGALHASAIEYALWHAIKMPEDDVVEAFEAGVHRWISLGGGAHFRGEDFQSGLFDRQAADGHCMIIDARQLNRLPR